MRDAGYSSGPEHGREVLLERLRWRVLHNPARRVGVPFGECVRSAEGEIVGSLVYTPIVFRLGDERLLGLNSGYFFTAPAARGWGLVLLRRFAQSAPAPIRYSSSLNAASGGLWRRLGGATPQGSDTELFCALRWRPLLEESVMQRGGAARFAPIGAIGAYRNAVRRLRDLGKPRVRMQASRDWDELAELAEHNRPHDALVADRSAAYLRWRFEQCPGPERIDVQRFEDDGGRSGWVALMALRRGRRQQIRIRAILTLVPSREAFDASALLRALADHCRRDVDLLLLGASVDWPAQAPRGVAVDHLAEPSWCMAGADAAGRPFAERARLSFAEGDAVE